MAAGVVGADGKKAASECTLTLENTSEVTVLFKVKTTAPTRYCVRPNSGEIRPGDKQFVSGMMYSVNSRPVLP